MNRKNIKDFIRIAKDGVDDGIKIAETTARRVADSVGDGVDSAREGMRKAKLSRKVQKSIDECIKDLEDANKAAAPGNIQTNTTAIIETLKKLVEEIKQNPHNAGEIIAMNEDFFREQRDNASDNVPGDLIEVQVMNKHYDAAFRSCQLARETLEYELEEAKKEKEKESSNIIEIQDMKILIPLGFEKAGFKNHARNIMNALQKDEVAFRKMTSRSNGTLVINKTTGEKSMNFDSEQDIIDGIHEAMEDNQGLIEVSSGTTKRGYKYIYSIVKTIREEFMGAAYFLRMNLSNEKSVIEIQASFEEIGMTGERDSFCVVMAEKAGLVSMGENMSGWNEDPYDPEYTKGIPMNLAERPGLDALFPNHPLSQARELLLAIIEDKYVIVKKDTDENNENDDNALEEKYSGNDEQFWKDMFAKDPVFSRHTIDIEV